MTTLPQTTTVRVPRTAGPTTLMVPGLGMPGAQMQAAGSQMSGADVWRVIRANITLIIVSVIVFAAIGVGAFFWLARYYPRYMPIGLIEVRPTVQTDLLQPAPLTIDRAAIELAQRTQAHLLRQESLVGDTLKNSNELRNTTWFTQFGGNTQAAKQDFLDRLSVTPVVDSQLIQVSVSYSDAKDATTMVQELVNQHIQQQADAHRKEQLYRSQALNEMRKQDQIRLNDVNERIRDKGNSLAVDAMGVPGHLNQKEVQVGRIMENLGKEQSQQEAAKSALDRATIQIKKGEIPFEVEDMLTRDPMLASYRQQVDQLDVQITSLEKLGPDHPAMKELQARRAASLKKYDDLRAEQTAKYQTTYLDRLKAAVAVEDLAVARLQQELDGMQADLKKLTGDLNEYLDLAEQQKTLRETLTKIGKELDDIASYESRPEQAGVLWAQHPSVPDTRSFPQLKIILPLAILLGLALSVGLAFLREMLDTSIRTPRDIARIGQLNMLGIVPDEQDDPQVTGVRLPLAIFEAPQSIVAEQLRQIRTRLQHSVSLDTTRAILVTSAGPEDGKTVIACNIAAGLALNGRRILLVDANFRRPQLHTVFGLDNEKGFSNALANPAEFASLVKETAIPNLAVMACGPKPPNATELLESQLLIDFIDHALDDYDHIIFDSGPLLFVSESVALAPRVDGVVTVVRAQQNSRGALQRVRDTLRQIKAQQIGVVLNAVKAQGGGYYARNIRTYYEYQGNLPVKA